MRLYVYHISKAKYSGKIEEPKIRVRNKNRKQATLFVTAIRIILLYGAAFLPVAVGGNKQ